MPIKIINDNNYLPELTEKLEQYYYIKNESAFSKNSKLIDNIQFNKENIIGAVKDYLSGEIYNARNKIFSILKKYNDTPSKFFIAILDENYAFRGSSCLDLERGSRLYFDDCATKNELSFFRARIGEVSKRKDMLHIPLNKRSFISTQRFSIPGIPCLYLGTTTYNCWLELDNPSNENFNVSSYKFNKLGKNLKILNLVFSKSIINGIYSVGRESPVSNNKKIQQEALEIWPLVCATSFSVKEKNRAFKSEYIVSQLIMQCIKELKIDGIAYISKKINNDVSFSRNVNLAIPIFDIENEEFGEICNHFELTKPYNFSSFLNIKDANIEKCSYLNSIENNEKVHYNNSYESYYNLKFCDFDDYLVSKEHENFNSEK
ncbi:TPA: hypothetical protein RQA65_000918 [Clostridioides difficile]|nr:hypothetical protein [Clostridioides difficile]HDX7083470.1 hypothetical protein [Clostridioides difficile]